MIRKERSDDRVDAERRARASTVQSRLARREFTSASGAKPEQIFRSIPPRLTIPVERVIDDARKMLSCVLLGFTADGDHLVSYSAEGGENFSFELQIWKFQPGARARLLATTPLFESDMGDFGRGMRGLSEDFGGAFADAPTEANVRVHVCESWDRSTLVVHGEARRHGGEDGDGRGRIAKKCCVTVLPSPASVKPGTAIAATHMSYVSAALSPFHPSWSGVTPAATPQDDALELGDEGEDTCIGAPYAFNANEMSPRRKLRKSDAVMRDLVDGGKFALNTADALLTVDIATATLNPRDAHDRSLMEVQLQGSIGSLVSVIPACHSPLVKWHGSDASDLSVGNEDVYVEDQGVLGDTAPYVYVSALPRSVRVCIITPWIALEMSKVLNSSLRAALDFGFTLRDYELFPLQYIVSPKSGEEPSMLVASLSVLAPSSWSHQPTCPGRMRVVVTIIDRQLDRTLSSGGHVVYSHELPVHTEGKQPTETLLHAARVHVMQMRKTCLIPTARWTRNASTMTNTNVVMTGRSASTIKHPTLPICIVGYGIRSTQD